MTIEERQVVCPMCNGTTLCYHCGGTGKIEIPPGSGRFVGCKVCKLTGICPTCRGKGEIKETRIRP